MKSSLVLQQSLQQQESERARLCHVQYQDSSFSEGNAIFESLNGFILIVNENSEVFYSSKTVEQFIGFHQVSPFNHFPHFQTLFLFFNCFFPFSNFSIFQLFSFFNFSHFQTLFLFLNFFFPFSNFSIFQLFSFFNFSHFQTLFLFLNSFFPFYNFLIFQLFNSRFFPFLTPLLSPLVRHNPPKRFRAHPLRRPRRVQKAPAMELNPPRRQATPDPQRSPLKQR